jgi:ubiquinone/menaquinone biosynthesis C-methylase UbiE
LLTGFGVFQKQKIILEIGCGTGELTQRFLRQQGQGLIAIDISLDLIKKAKEKIGGLGVSFIACDAERLPLKDGCIDSLIGVSILHHLDLNITIPEIARVLKPAGKIGFSEPNILNPQVFLTKKIAFVSRWMGDVEGEVAFCRWVLRRQLISAGFRQIRVEPFDFLHPCVPAPLINFVQFFGKLFERIPILREIAGSLAIYAKKE